MPEPISRSTVSQIASYGPPEELSSQAPKAEAPKVAPPATSDIGASHAPLERATVKQLSYEGCIATHEKAGAERLASLGAVGGCLTFGAAGAGVSFTTLKNPVPGFLVGCVGGGISGGLAAITVGTTRGATEGKIACDDLPKKL